MTDPVTEATSPYALARQRGVEQGRQVAKWAPDEREAWLNGLVEAVGRLPLGGLVMPPDGWVWAEDLAHTAAGTAGLAHLIPHPDRLLRAVAGCGMERSAWVLVGRWETDRREACPTCAGQRVVS